MRELISIDTVKEVIFQVESVLFNCKNTKEVDHEKLQVNSQNYNTLYEKRLRRKEINYVWLLDEILEKHQIEKDFITNNFYELENILFSSCFYKNLILGKEHPQKIKKIFYRAYKQLINGINIFDKYFNEEVYFKNCENYKFINAPKSKKDFLAILEKFGNELLKKSNKCDTIS